MYRINQQTLIQVELYNRTVVGIGNVVVKYNKSSWDAR